MPYATVEDITNRYGENFLYTIADRDNDDTLDTTAVENALSDASEHINAFLATRYTLPLDATPALLKRICVDIAVYWLGEDRGGATEERRQRFEDSEGLLNKIASGKVGLGMETAPNTSGGNASIECSERLFNRESLRGW